MASQKKKNEVERSFAGMLIELILCAFCMLIGFLMLFVDSMKIEYFAYVIGGVLLAIGIYLILNFFVRHGYKEITNYDFSGGVLVTAIGIVVLINAKEFDVSFYIIIGIILLIISVMILQSVIQLKGMHGKAWWLDLIFALLILVYAILILTRIKTSFSENETIYYSLVIASGALGIFSIIITSIRSVYFKKEEEEKAEKKEKEAVDYSRPEISDTKKGYRQTDIEADYEEISEPDPIEKMKNQKKKFSFEMPKREHTDFINAKMSDSSTLNSLAPDNNEALNSDFANAEVSNLKVSQNVTSNSSENINDLNEKMSNTSENTDSVADDSDFDDDELSLLRKSDD